MSSTRGLWAGLLVLVVAIGVTASVLLGHSTSGSGSTHRSTGITQDREAPPYRSQVFVTTDRWAGEASGRRYQVYAGARVAPSRGVAVRSELLLYTVGSSGPPVFVGAYTPPRGGREPLRIVSSKGDVLEVRTSVGSALWFDVARRMFERD